MVLHSSSLIPMFGVYFVFGYLDLRYFHPGVGCLQPTLKEAQSYIRHHHHDDDGAADDDDVHPEDANGLRSRVCFRGFRFIRRSS